jgi:hypothetical protein
MKWQCLYIMSKQKNMMKYIKMIKCDDTSIFIRIRGPLNIKDQADKSAHKELGSKK